ncbi:MAG TPA: hypothetical protein VF795_11760 [Desulfuromonadaceae bacterium]
MARARDIDPAAIALIKGEWEAAPYGQKGRVIKKAARLFQTSYQTLYAALGIGQKRKGEAQIEGIEEAARTVARYKFMAPEHRRQKVTEDARDQAIANGDLEERFRDVPPGTFDRWLRKLGLVQKKARKERFQALRPNQLHHIDASASDAFYIAAQLPDGDYLLKLHKGHKDYKNKPLFDSGNGKLQPWLYGYTDDYSGCWTARYVAAVAENALDNIDFLCWGWSPESGMPWFGLPERLMGDKGPMIRSKAIREFLGRTGIKVEKTMPGNKDEHGKIEKIWDVIWSRFEATFFTGDWQSFTITLSELNRQLGIFARRWNSKRKHRYEKKYTRLQMWERINLCGGAVLFLADAIKTVVRAWDREVDQCGCFTIDGETFEVKGLHLAKARIYKGAMDGKMVAMDLRDGSKYEVVAFRPNALDEFRGNAKTEHQRVREEAAELTGARPLLFVAEAPAAVQEGPRRVVKMRTRTSVREIDNPLNLDTYPSLAAAVWDFQQLAFLTRKDDFPAELREEVSALIAANGLSRRFVAGLAAEVLTEDGQRVAL